MTAPLMRLLVAAAATLSLVACSVFPDQPAFQMFELPTPGLEAASAESIDRTLRVTTPLAMAPIDSNRILVKPDDHEIRAYEGARWSNRAPVIIGNYLLESFRQDGRMATVVGNSSPARSDLTLAGDLTRFQAEYPGAEHPDGNPVVHLQLNLQLINERSRDTVASKDFEVSRPANGEDVESVVEAFGKASDELARQVIEWTAEQI